MKNIVIEKGKELAFLLRHDKEYKFDVGLFSAGKCRFFADYLDAAVPEDN